jgi:hypothetical protein
MPTDFCNLYLYIYLLVLLLQFECNTHNSCCS